MNNTNELGALAVALAKAQAVLRDPARNKSGQVRGKRDYRYAGLDDLLQTVRPVLSEHGLAIVQTIAAIDGKNFLVTTLLHGEGGSVSSHYPLDFSGGPQERGAELTYARRYSLEAIVGVSATDDDDALTAQEYHGNRSSSAPSRPVVRGGAPSQVSPAEGASGAGNDAEVKGLIKQIVALAPSLEPGVMDRLKAERRIGDPREAKPEALVDLLLAAQASMPPEPGSDLEVG